MGFIADERLAQGGFLQRDCGDAAGYGGAAYRLPPENRRLNLAPGIREAAEDYFARYGITWHRHASHGLSSQVCCLNFLMPLATRADILSRVVGEALGIDRPEMLEVEDGPDGRPWFVGFEWIGRENYLGEWPKGGRPTRGANATSADAIVRFHHNGLTETLLIEWKYTESYGAPIPPAGNATRTGRYAHLAFAPEGPIRANLGLQVEDFYWEPFYQLLRQQMLAMAMEKAREDGADRVRVLHISPVGNRELHRVTAPALRKLGADAFDAFSAVLEDPSAFIGRTTDQVFGSTIAALPADDPWRAYLADRYLFLHIGPAI